MGGEVHRVEKDLGAVRAASGPGIECELFWWEGEEGL